jgi:hypothetical protein
MRVLSDAVSIRCAIEDRTTLIEDRNTDELLVQPPPVPEPPQPPTIPVESPIPVYPVGPTPPVVPVVPPTTPVDPVVPEPPVVPVVPTPPVAPPAPPVVVEADMPSGAKGLNSECAKWRDNRCVSREQELVLPRQSVSRIITLNYTAALSNMKAEN